MILYVTYGYGSNLRNNYSRVEGKDTSDCYEQIERVCGDAYAFTYTEERFEGQPDKYGLTEVPLQAQIMNNRSFKGEANEN